MKILLAIDGSPYTKKMLAYLTTHEELMAGTHEYTALTVQTPLPPRARAALGKEGQDDFYASKLGTARFFFARLLPRIHSLTASVKAGSESLYLLDAAQF